MISIAITGGIGSGKSVAGDYLKEKGFKVLDADEISRIVVSPYSDGLQQIVKCFGEEILNADSSLNRKMLAEIVFKDSEKLKQLNHITHPLIAEEIDRQISELQMLGKEKYVFIMIPLLFELGWHQKFDRVWLVLADSEKRAERAAKRDKTTKDTIYKRINNQINYGESSKFAHNILYNNNTLQDFYNQVECALRGLDGYNA